MSLSINSFRTAGAAAPDARLKVVDVDTTGKPIQAERGLIGKAVHFLREHTVLGRVDGRTMASFKKELSKEYDPASVKQMQTAITQAKKELDKLDKLYHPSGWPKDPHNADAKKLKNDVVVEMRARLRMVANASDIGGGQKLTGKTVASAERLTKLLHDNRNDPMVKMMGPVKFLGYALKSEINIAAADQRFQQCAANMTTCEKVALYGYTCADYTVLNPALRDKTNAPAPGVQSYIDHASAAVLKCPVYDDGKNQGKGISTTERAINDPKGKTGWAAERYANNTQVVEDAFTSSSEAGKGTAGTFKMVITGTGYEVAPFSAWPAEAEILYPPGTTFKISVDAADPKVFKATVA